RCTRSALALRVITATNRRVQFVGLISIAPSGNYRTVLQGFVITMTLPDFRLIRLLPLASLVLTACTINAPKGPGKSRLPSVASASAGRAQVESVSDAWRVCLYLRRSESVCP